MIHDILIVLVFFGFWYLIAIFIIEHGSGFMRLFRPVVSENNELDWNYVKKVFEPYDPAVLDTSEWKRIPDYIVKHKETGVEIWVGTSERFMEEWNPKREMNLDYTEREYVHRKLSEVL